VSRPVEQPPPLNPRRFWPGLVIGWAFIVFGIYSVFANGVRWLGFGEWFAAGILAHDLLLAPLVFLVGALLGRVVSRRYLAPIQGGLIATGLLLLFSFPAISGKGDRAGDPSRLPNDYRLYVGLVAVGIWAVTLIFVLRAVRRRPVSDE
jgi:hypothetical protein